MKKIVELEMDKTRHLKYGINTMVQVEKELGKPLSSLDNQQFKLGDLRILLYLGLKWEDNTITLESTGDLMDLAIEKHGMPYLSEKLGLAIQGAFGQGGMNAMPS